MKLKKCLRAYLTPSQVVSADTQQSGTEDRRGTAWFWTQTPRTKTTGSPRCSTRIHRRVISSSDSPLALVKRGEHLGEPVVFVRGVCVQNHAVPRRSSVPLCWVSADTTCEGVKYALRHFFNFIYPSSGNFER